MPKVSVIIPVYGVEKYIERCARSLFEQTLDDMEFVFVDDCTKDKSIEILNTIIEQYPNRKDQIKIIHHKINKGLSHARETGIKCASGDYIGHCDSDDWVDKEMFYNMYQTAKLCDYDYVKCGYKKSDGKNVKEINKVYNPSLGVLSKKDIIKYLLHWKEWNSIWNTLIKRDVYLTASLQFTEFPMLEDFYVVSQLILQSNSFGIVDRTYYNYYVNPQSICGTSDVCSCVNRARQAKKNMDWIIGNIQSKISLCKDDVIYAKWGVQNILIPILSDKKNYKYWREIYPETRRGVLFLKTLSFRNKLRFYASDFNIMYIIQKFILRVKEYGCRCNN